MPIYADSMKIQLKNNLKYGVAHRNSNGVLNIANICTFDVDNCQIGTVTKGGVPVPVEKMAVKLVINGVTIMPGETKEIPSQYFQRFGRGGAFRDGVSGSAFYDDVEVKFNAPNIQPELYFPADFVRTSD